MADIDNLVIKISSDASEAVKGIKDLARGLADTASQCSRAANSLKDVAKSTKDVGEASAEAADSTGKLEEEAKETAGTFKETASSVAKYGKELQNTSKETEKATGKFAQFLASIKRIALYRAIRSAIKAITTALKEGFDMFVTWDRESNNAMAGAANAVDRLKEAATGLKGSLGALLGGLVTQLEPLITRIVGWLTQLVDLIQMISRALQGQSTYYKLVYKGAKSAAGAAKELKKVLFGFDELNILPSQSGGGVSSDSGAWEYVEEPIRLLETLGDLLPGLGLLAGGYIGLKGILPGLINLFKRKNSALSDQTSKVTADATATEGYATNLGLASEGARGLTGQLGSLAPALGIMTASLLAGSGSASSLSTDLNNASTSAANLSNTLSNSTFDVKTSADLSGVAAAGAGVSVLKQFIQSNPISIPITAPFTAVASAFESLRNQVQTFFNNNAIRIPVAVANGSATGKGYRTSSFASSFADPLKNYSGTATSSKVTAADVEQQIRQAFNDYESDLWNQGGTFGKLVGIGGIAAIGTALSGVVSGVASIASLLSALGLASGFASGGTPDTGSLFWAGEHGAELVTHASGGTEVLNGNQVQTAMQNANLEVVNAVYAMANAVVGAVNGKNFDVYLDSAKVGHSVTQYQYNQARRGVTQGAY